MRRSLHQRLDLAGAAIAHPTAQAEPFGLPLQGVAKADTLDAAADQQADCPHLSETRRSALAMLWAMNVHGKLRRKIVTPPRVRGRSLQKGDLTMRAALLVIAGLALAGFLAVAFVLPQLAGSDAKEAAQALIAGAEAARQQVAAAAEKSGQLAGAGASAKLAARTDPKHGELKWIVEASGAIRGWNEKNAIEVSITPALQGGKVTWNCRGYPITVMPASCGGKS
ncbi:MAG TPA: hypothetical protein VFB53_10395 [Burkholderiales bacterium]|nr:hypothetical protein [Burkholderiales bacterium]